MTDDLVLRMRRACSLSASLRLLDEGADEIERLRALLRQARGYIHPETTWCYDAPEGWLEDRIDAALTGEKP